MNAIAGLLVMFGLMLLGKSIERAATIIATRQHATESQQKGTP